MKLVVLNYPNECVEIYDLTQEQAGTVDSDDYESLEYEILDEFEIDTNSCHWMFVNDDYVEIYLNNESNPVIAL